MVGQIRQDADLLLCGGITLREIVINLTVLPDATTGLNLHRLGHKIVLAINYSAILYCHVTIRHPLVIFCLRRSIFRSKDP